MDIAVLFHGRLRDNEKHNTTKISEFVKNNFKTNDLNVTFYGHFWDEDENKTRYLDYCDSENMVVESNLKYHDKINKIVSQVTTYIDADESIQRNGGRGCINRLFGQVSKLISINKAIQLIPENKKYEYVYIYRPDYICWDTVVHPKSIQKNTFYLNKHGIFESGGESIFVLHQSNLILFKEMLERLEDINNKFVPQCHYWFYNYFVNIKKLNFELLDYNVGVNCEQLSLMYLYYNPNNNIHQLIKSFNYFL